MKNLLSALAIVLGLGLATAQQTAPAAVQQIVKSGKSTKPAAVPAKTDAAPVNAKMKKDGTPDKRYKENKKLKKDGTPDKRYKVNK